MSVSLARLAHELKTPISAIAAAADVMRREEFGAIENEKYRIYIADIHASAMLSLTVIDRMLANQFVGRLEEGVQPEFLTGPVHSTQFDAGALVKSVASSMEPLANAAGIELAVSNSLKDSAKEQLCIRADEVSVTQMLLNLVNNAIKFTPSGGQVELHTGPSVEGGVAISIRDTGSGMTDRQIANALAGKPDPDQDGPLEGRGPGIGLPLVHALCEANGARMTMTSNGPKQGTIATLTFPNVATTES